MGNNKSNEVIFTKDQIDAINSVKQSTIVAASAGSGKTTTMIERVKRILLNEVDIDGQKTNIDQIILVTFTEASAKEMKEKLKLALENKLNETKDKKLRDLLIDQLSEVSMSQISTIHSLCGDIVRKFFDEAEVDPNFTVMDDKESSLLLNKVIDDTISSIDKEEDFQEYIEDYNKLVDFLDWELKSNIINAYNYVCATKDPDEFLKATALASYNSDTGNELLNEYLKNLKKPLISLKNKMSDCNSQIKLVGKEDTSKTLTFLNNYRVNEELLKIESIEDFLKKLKPVEDIEGLQKPSKSYKELDDKIGKLNTKFKNVIKDLLKKAIELPYDVHQEYIKEDIKLLKAFIKLLTKIKKNYANKKKEENRLDFDDLQLYALKVLKNEDIANTYKDYYRVVCVDEYQDTNPIQDEIISKISTDKNLFLVGDLKQAIYGFRLTDSKILSDKMDKYKADNKKLIRFKSNHRSQEDILRFVDKIFSKLYVKREDLNDKYFGGVDYFKDSRFLEDAKEFKLKDITNVKVKRFYYEKNEKSSTESISDEIYDIENSDNTSKRITKQAIYVEAQYIKDEINKLIRPYNGQPAKYKPSDIAILYRSRCEKVEKIINYLRDNKDNKGIMVDMSDYNSQSNNPVIDVLISLLKVIDNEKQDIPLVASLNSMIGNLSLDDLQILNNYKYKVFGTSKVQMNRLIHDYINDNNNDDKLSEKINKFYERIDIYRQKATFMTVSELLNYIFEDVNLDKYIQSLENSREVSEQLNDFFVNVANMQYNNSLSRFISSYEELQIDKESSSKISGEDSLVKLSTIHHSKGLEYKVVFLINASAGQKPSNDKMLFDRKYGFFIKHFDAKEKVFDDTYLVRGIKSIKEFEELEEKSRVFYVALTRAKELLYITYTTSNNRDKEKDFKDLKSFSDWLEYTFEDEIEEHKCINAGKLIFYNEQDENDSDREEQIKIEDKEHDDTDIDSSLEKYEKEYDYKVSTSMPIVYSVTEINKMHLQDSDENKSLYEDAENLGVKKVSPQEGTAYHRVLELIDFNAFNVEDIDKQLKIFVLEGLLTEEQYELVDKNVILNCINRYRKLVTSQKVLQEQRFEMYIKASTPYLFPENSQASLVDDKIMVIGAFDMFIPASKDNPYNILIDFKRTNESADKIKERYRNQLEIYSMAIEKNFGYKVDKKIIYIVGQDIEISI